MGVLGFLKRKKHEDIDDIRSHILGEPAPRLTQPPARLNESRFEPQGFEESDEPYAPQYPAPSPGYGRLAAPRPAPLRDDLEAFEPFAPQPREEKLGRDYDIAQRLDVIEAQLGAIRSQTETINERLKNLEMKLGQRRY